MRPKAAATWSMEDRTCAGSDTSQASAMAPSSVVADRMSVATSMSSSATWYPCEWNFLATASPMPRTAPVTTATLVI